MNTNTLLTTQVFNVTITSTAPTSGANSHTAYHYSVTTLSGHAITAARRVFALSMGLEESEVQAWLHSASSLSNYKYWCVNKNDTENVQGYAFVSFVTE